MEPGDSFPVNDDESITDKSLAGVGPRRWLGVVVVLFGLLIGAAAMIHRGTLGLGLRARLPWPRPELDKIEVRVVSKDPVTRSVEVELINRDWVPVSFYPRSHRVIDERGEAVASGRSFCGSCLRAFDLVPGEPYRTRVELPEGPHRIAWHVYVWARDIEDVTGHLGSASSKRIEVVRPPRSELTRLLEDSALDRCQEVFTALEEEGAALEERAAALIRILEANPRPEARRWACEALVSRTEDARSARAALERRLQSDEDAGVRELARQALQLLGDP